MNLFLSFRHYLLKGYKLGPFLPQFAANDVIKGVKISEFLNIDIINELSALKLIHLEVLEFQTLFVEKYQFWPILPYLGGTISNFCDVHQTSDYIFGFSDDFSSWVQHFRKIGEILRQKLKILDFHICMEVTGNLKRFLEVGQA